MQKMIQSRVNLTPQAVRLFNQLKVQFDLKDRSEAINKLAELNAGKMMTQEDWGASMDAIRTFDREVETEMKKHPGRRMTHEEMDRRWPTKN